VLGKKSRAAIARFPEESRASHELRARFDRPTLWDAFLRYLAREGYPIPAEHLGRDVTLPIEPSPEIQRLLADIYRKDPKNASVCERLVDLDEGVQEWRYRHVKMVERTIGTKPGTGGSAGSEYLRTTLGQPAFPDLWAVRALL
jgi:tryptophan 2,3-dioxygenase